MTWDDDFDDIVGGEAPATLPCCFIANGSEGDSYLESHLSSHGVAATSIALASSPPTHYNVLILHAISGGDGVIRRLKSLRNERPMAIILCIAKDDPYYQEQLFESGATDVFTEDLAPSLVAKKIGSHTKLAANSHLIEVQNEELIRNMRQLRERNDQLGQEMERRKIAELERAKAIDAAAEGARLASLGELAATIAHEIRTPMSFIQFTTAAVHEELDTYPELKEKCAESFADVKDMIERINQIIKGLTTFARNVDNDTIEIVAVSQILKETRTLVEDRLRLADIEVIWPSPESSEIPLECRSIQIGQILVNLLNNAKDALEGVSKGHIAIKVQDLGDDLTITVADNGPGIPDELKEKVFHKAFTTKPKGKGTGLGLHISETCAKAHGGTLTLSDTPGGGATFVLKVPKLIPRIEDVSNDNAAA